MEGISLTPLKIISHPLGDIYHIIKTSDQGFKSFGEAYFSTIKKDAIKGWKKHTKMTLNLTVPVGEVCFVLFNEKDKQFQTIYLSLKNYQRLTVPPGWWMAFKGEEENNLILNVADILHDPEEAEKRELSDIHYNWN